MKKERNREEEREKERVMIFLNIRNGKKEKREICFKKAYDRFFLLPYYTILSEAKFVFVYTPP